MTVVGIDLGTTYSLVSRLSEDGRPVVVPNAEGELTTPSAVYFENDVDAVVGKHAVAALRDAPSQVVQHAKRFLGDRDHRYHIHGSDLSPLAISAIILRKLRQDTEQQVGPIAGAVITVPAYFDEGRRQATAAAGELADLKVLDIISEPTAAALAAIYEGQRVSGAGPDAALRRILSDDAVGHTLIYDLGGGTFDVSLVQHRRGHLTVLATAGDVQLGGIDWTRRIANHIAEEFLTTHGLDPRQDAIGTARLTEVAETLKRELSSRRRVSWDYIFSGKHLEGVMTREAFEAMTSDLLYRTENRLDRVLRDARVGWEMVGEVVAVGGSTRLPQVQAMLERVSGRKPNTSLSPDHLVAKGAAIHAAMQAVEAQTESAPSNASTSAAATPAPVPASSTAVQPPLVRWTRPLIQLLTALRTTNVNAHSLGVVARDKAGNKFVSQMIPKNTPLPAAKVKCFGTISKNQKRITVEIVEGEAEDPAYCIDVGVCTVLDLPEELPKGSPVEVQFAYDNSGRLHVEVVHVTSGAWGQVVIHRSAGIDPERIHLSQEILGRLAVS